MIGTPIASNNLKLNMKKFIFTIALLTTSIIVLAQAEPGVIKVKGEAVVKAVPENMEVSIPLEARDTSYEACNGKITQTYNSLQRALEKNGIQKSRIKSNGIRISEDYQYSGGERRFIGYVGNVSLTLEEKYTDEKLNAVLRTLRTKAFNFGYNISFLLSDSQRELMREDAILKATADAQKKAKMLASAMNVGLAQIREISYGYLTQETNPIMYRSESKMMNAGNMEDVSVNAKEIEVTKQVGIIWDINQ